MKRHILTNLQGDQYTKSIIPKQSKSENVRVWDELDHAAEDALKKVAAAAGIQILELGDLQDIKELVERMVDVVKDRFGVEPPFVDEDY